MRAKLTSHQANGVMLRETLISTVPNSVVSAGFVWLVFHGQTRIPLWGMNGFTIQAKVSF